MKQVSVTITDCTQCPYYLYIESTKSKMTGCFCEREMELIMSIEEYSLQQIRDLNETIEIPLWCPLEDV